MTLYLKVTSNRPGASGIVLVNSTTDTGYKWLSDEYAASVFGQPEFEPIMAGAVDVPPELSGEGIGARAFQMTFLVGAATSPTADGTAAYVRALAQEVRNIAKYGGVMRFRPSSLTYAVEFELVHASIADLYSHQQDLRAQQTVTVQFVARPHATPDGMRVHDKFSADSLGTAGIYNDGGRDYTVDAGAITNGTVSGGVVDAAANLSTNNRWVHTGTAATYSDMQASVKHAPGATLTNYRAGVLLKRTASNNYISVYCGDTGAASNVYIATTVAGSTNVRSTTSITRIVASTPYWLVARIEGNVVYVEHWTTEPTPMGSTPTTATYQLTSAEAAALGQGVMGRGGLDWTPIHTSAYVDDLKIWPCVYKASAGRAFPEVVDVRGTIPGDEGSRCAFEWTQNAANPPKFMLASWWEKPQPHNFVWNDGAESNTTSGWGGGIMSFVVTTGVTLTVTSTAGQYRSGRYGFSCAVTSGSTNRGSAFTIYGRFKQGVTYSASMYVKATSGTNNVQLKLGHSSDTPGTSSSTALSSSWQQLTCTWTPTADRENADVAIYLPSSVTQTWFFDDVMVYEGTTAPVYQPGGNAALGIIEAEAVDVDNKGSAFTITANAAYRSGYYLAASGALSTNGELEYFIHPWAMIPDDYANDYLSIGVIARVLMASTQTDLNCVLSAEPEGGSGIGGVFYTAEYGTTGKYPTLPSSGTATRPVFLGTLRLPVRRDDPVRWKLRTYWTNSSGATSSFFVDYLALYSDTRCLRSQSGVASSTQYATFQSQTSVTRRIEYDGRGLARDASKAVDVQPGWYPSNGLGGNRFVLPATTRGCEVLVLPSSYIMDITSSSTDADIEEHTGCFALDPVPTLALLQDD